MDFLVRGYSGYNTRWALKVLDKVFPPEKEVTDGSPVAVTVFFGANDACLPDRSGSFQHVPIDEYKNNLSSIISSLKVALTLFSFHFCVFLSFLEYHFSFE